MAIYEQFTNQKQWKEYIQYILKVSDKALLRAIVLIYDNQTEEEKRTKESNESNGVGFNKVDAKEMGAIAIKIKRGIELDEIELAKSRRRMPKYWKQLMIISKRKMEYESMILKEREEMLRGCLEDGNICTYGICDECPNMCYNEDRGAK